MNNIALIGVGQLGSRHLQALQKLQLASNVFILEPNRVSVGRAKRRVEETVSNKHINNIYIKKIQDLPNTIDLAIVATSAGVRASVTLDLLSKAKVKNLVLEKFMFQSKEQFAKVKKVLTANHVKCWVNCPRRSWLVYRNIKEEIGDGKMIQVLVSGSKWGLLSNAIHFIDLCAFFTSSSLSEVTVNITNIQMSKRPGYIEADGTLTGYFESELYFSVVSHPQGQEPVVTCVNTGTSLYVINESAQIQYYLKFDYNKTLTKSKIQIPLVSQTTTQIVNDILTTGNCQLPTYDHSERLHLQLLGSFKSVIEKETGKKLKYLPIT